MNYVNAFEKIKPEIKKADVNKLAEHFAIQITMTDEDCGGIFYVSFFGEELDVQPFDYVDNTVAIALSYLSLSNLIAGRSKLDNLIATGKVQVSGRAEIVKMLLDAMPEKPKKEKKPAKESKKK